MLRIGRGVRRLRLPWGDTEVAGKRGLTSSCVQQDPGQGEGEEKNQDERLPRGMDSISFEDLYRSKKNLPPAQKEEEVDEHLKQFKAGKGACVKGVLSLPRPMATAVDAVLRQVARREKQQVKCSRANENVGQLLDADKVEALHHFLYYRDLGYGLRMRGRKPTPEEREQEGKRLQDKLSKESGARYDAKKEKMVMINYGRSEEESNVIVDGGEVQDREDDDLKARRAAKRAAAQFIPLHYGREETHWFLRGRITQVYGATYRVLEEISRRTRPVSVHSSSSSPLISGTSGMFRPSRVLDFGSGLGCTAWAVDALWGREDVMGDSNAGTGSESIGPPPVHYEGVDVSLDMVEMADRLLRLGYRALPNIPKVVVVDAEESNQEMAVPNVQFRRYLPEGGRGAYDLVVSAFSLSEVSPKERMGVLEKLWDKTSDFLVIIEMGTPDGFQLIKQCRESIICGFNSPGKEEAEFNAIGKSVPGHVFAPCPHEMKCPKTKEPCHFVQRTMVTPRQRISGNLRTRNFVHERFSYVVMRKGKREHQMAVESNGNEFVSQWSRVISPSSRHKGHIRFRACHSDGTIDDKTPLTKAVGKDWWKEGKKTDCGDLLPPRAIMQHYKTEKNVRVGAEKLRKAYLKRAEAHKEHPEGRCGHDE